MLEILLTNKTKNISDWDVDISFLPYQLGSTDLIDHGKRKLEFTTNYLNSSASLVGAGVVDDSVHGLCFNPKSNLNFLAKNNEILGFYSGDSILEVEYVLRSSDTEQMRVLASSGNYDANGHKKGFAILTGHSSSTNYNQLFDVNSSGSYRRHTITGDRRQNNIISRFRWEYNKSANNILMTNINTGAKSQFTTAVAGGESYFRVFATHTTGAGGIHDFLLKSLRFKKL